jgi:hypothetical protein
VLGANCKAQDARLLGRRPGSRANRHAQARCHC